MDRRALGAYAPRDYEPEVRELEARLESAGEVGQPRYHAARAALLDAQADIHRLGWRPYERPYLRQHEELLAKLDRARELVELLEAGRG